MFASGCFTTAPPTLAQCAGAPASTEIIDSARRAATRWQAEGQWDNRGCLRVVQVLQEFCRKRSGAKP